MAYNSGSALPSHDHGGKQYDSLAPVYEDMDLGDQDEEEHVTPLPLATTLGGLLVNRCSRSIEKGRRKNKRDYKFDVVIQMCIRRLISQNEVVLRPLSTHPILCFFVRIFLSRCSWQARCTLLHSSCL